MFIEKFYPIMEKSMQDNALEHHHNSKMKDGASSRYGCILKKALKKKGINLPQITGVRSETGALYTGSNFHQDIQGSLRKAWFNDPIERAKYIYIEEIYVCMLISEMSYEEITEKLMENSEAKEFLMGKEGVLIPDPLFEHFPNWDQDYIFCKSELIPRNLFDVINQHPEWLEKLNVKMMISPIDIGYITRPGYVLKMVEFNNCMKWKPVLAEGAKFIQIVDIKSCSDYSFYEQLNGKLSPNYDYQFQSYMESTNLPELTEIAVHKENMRMFEKIVRHRDSFYDELLNRESRLWDIINLLPDKFDPTKLEEYPSDITEYDLDCVCNSDSFEFWSCGLCDCHEELDNRNKPHNIIDKLCPLAEKFLVDKAKDKFRSGMKFKRGSSNITIDHWEGSICIVTNKSGTVYKDHAKYCLDNYTVM